MMAYHLLALGYAHCLVKSPDIQSNRAAVQSLREVANIVTPPFLDSDMRTLWDKRYNPQSQTPNKFLTSGGWPRCIGQ